MKRLFNHDPLTGITEWFESTDNGFAIVYEQDAEPIVELNKKKQSMGRDYYVSKAQGDDCEMWRGASIPITVQYDWATKHGITDVTDPEHWPKVRRLLNSNEYRYLKTAEVII